MKKLFIFSFAILFFLPGLKAQVSFGEILRNKEMVITFFGLDFSAINLVGEDGFSDPEDIKENYFGKWNALMIDEKSKYDLEEALRKYKIEYDLDMVQARNEAVDWTELVSNRKGDSEHLDLLQVRDIVQSYDLGDHQGIGLVFIMESFNKLEREGNMWVTFFDCDTKNVIYSERMSGRVGGFGLRNYWARSIYEVIVEIEKKRYKKWMKEYK